jgi:prepilin-type N-terminal cleavage/methylation domain-containing protein
MCRERVRDVGGRGRPAFTLVELLLVIAIIAALVALSASAVLRFRIVQTTWNTKNLVQRLNSQFRKQWSTVADQARRENIPLAYQPLVNQLAGGDADRARVIWVKLRLKQAFPVSFQEALNPNPLLPLDSYQQFLTGLGYTAATPMTQYDPKTPLGVYDSSACLLMALKRGPSGMGVDVEDLVGSSNLRDIPTPSGGTIKVMVDSWGTPLLFSRWPVGNCLTKTPSGSTWPYPIGHSDINPKLNAALFPNPPGYTYASGNNDPTDPMGRLTNDGTWLANDTAKYQAGQQSFQGFCHPLLTPQPGYSLYLPPVIVSAGLQSTAKATNFGFDYKSDPTQPVWNLALDPNYPNDHDSNIYSTDLP